MHMEPQTNEPESVIEPLKKVTPLSKYLAMALFIALPFLGGLVGYRLAPERMVEVPVSSNKVAEVESMVNTFVLYQNPDLGVSFEYPSQWMMRVNESSSSSASYTGKEIAISSSEIPSNTRGSQISVVIMEISKLGAAFDSVEDILQGKNSSDKSSIENPVPVTIAGIDGVTYTVVAEGSGFKMALFENKGLAYYISMQENDSGTESSEEVDVFNNLIQTFKITN